MILQYNEIKSSSNLKTVNYLFTVCPLLWFLSAFMGSFSVMAGIIININSYNGGEILWVSILLICYIIYVWWNIDVIGANDLKRDMITIQHGLKLGILTFLVSLAVSLVALYFLSNCFTFSAPNFSFLEILKTIITSVMYKLPSAFIFEMPILRIPTPISTSLYVEDILEITMMFNDSELPILSDDSEVPIFFDDSVMSHVSTFK